MREEKKESKYNINISSISNNSNSISELTLKLDENQILRNNSEIGENIVSNKNHLEKKIISKEEISKETASQGLNSKSTITFLENIYIDYPNFYFFSLFGITFCQIGNLISFYFEKNNNFKPKFCFGPHYFLSITINIMIIIFSFLFYFFIFKKLNTTFIFIFLLLVVSVSFVFNICSLINPGIVFNKKRKTQEDKFCSKCQTYTTKEEKSHHCSMCNSCIYGYDHHCIWVGKCIGKGNKIYFYSMLFLISITYVYTGIMGFFLFKK